MPMVAHYGGTDELDSAGALTAAAPQQDENWFYTDHDDVQHGPFALVQLKGWLEGGHFETSKLVCNRREGQLVELGSVVQVKDTSEETRIGEDAFAYKKAAFVAHYGGTDEWDAAGTLTAAAPQQDENWFYTDHDDVQHGPFTLVKLKGWLEGGHFETSKVVCNGREGPRVCRPATQVGVPVGLDSQRLGRSSWAWVWLFPSGRRGYP